MSSEFTHLFIPVVILLVFSKYLRLDPRKILILSFFAVLPDLDMIMLPHRALLHNIFIVIVPLLLFVLVKSKRDIFGIMSFYLVAHLILDIFNGGIILLHPISNNVYFVHAELRFTHGFTSILEWGISDRIMNSGKGEAVISSENVGSTVLLIICLFILVLRQRKV